MIASVRKTGYAIVVDEGVERFGTTAELASKLTTAAFDWLDAPVLRIGAANVPIPFSPTLEMPTILNTEQIVETVLAQRG